MAEPSAPPIAAPAPTPAPASLAAPLPTTPEAALLEIEQIRRDKTHPLRARGMEHAPAVEAALKAQWGALAPEGFAWAERGAQLYAARPGAQGKIARAALVDRDLRDVPAVYPFLAYEGLADEIRRVTVQPKTREDAAYVRAYRNARDPNHETAVSYVRELFEMRHRLTGR